jgi:hypothetical protein
MARREGLPAYLALALYFMRSGETRIDRPNANREGQRLRSDAKTQAGYRITSASRPYGEYTEYDDSP